MARLALLLCAAALASASASAAAAAGGGQAQAAVIPVQKVIQLLDGMIAKGKKEKHAEQVQFAAYKQFCDDTSAGKQKSIKQANEQIEVLKADIEKYSVE